MSKSTDELFSPLCQLQLSISQSMPVVLVPCFVGVHHILSQNRKMLDLKKKSKKIKKTVYTHVSVHGFQIAWALLGC